ncbi:MinD/ParA family protein [Roseateles sp. BYS180W]|uniref:MinD/ParA family protein n=1 Tax=Roseateles rivi TaxID=3299028 RepID=A0ABW7FV00_9BURK
MPPPHDQAAGLRQLFASRQMRVIPVVSNPHVLGSGALLEGLCAAFSELGLRTLVVDAGELSPEAPELAAVDLASCIEPLSPRVSYLAARGLPMRYINAHGSAARLVELLADAAPQCQVLVLHASAAELARLLAQREVRPVLLADTDVQSVTHAYAGMKWLSQRAGVMVYSLLLACSPQLRLAQRIAEQLSSCGDGFLGAVLRDWACMDPRQNTNAPLEEPLRQLARELLHATAPAVGLEAAAHAQPLRPRVNVTALGSVALGRSSH